MNRTTHGAVLTALLALAACGGEPTIGEGPIAAARSALIAVHEQAKLLPADGGDDARFGDSVAIDGDTALVGAINADGIKPGSGAAYVYHRSGTTWTQEAKLLASDGHMGDQFGCAVALSKDTAVIGASASVEGGVIAGAAYVFTRSGSTWTAQARIVANPPMDGGGFGSSVTILGDTAAVGETRSQAASISNGYVHIFARSGSAWSEETSLQADDSTLGDLFGASLSLSGDTLAVGASNALSNANMPNNPPVNSGAVYVFTRAGVTWSQQAKIVASTTTPDDQLGASVSLDQDTLLVGAPNFTDPMMPTLRGVAYAFERTGKAWSQRSKLLPESLQAYQQTGQRVAVSGNLALVSSPLAGQSAAFAGAASVFTRSGGTWSERGTITASDAGENDQFGSALALSGSTGVIGAGFIKGMGMSPGKAYAYLIKHVKGDKCADSAECDSGFCVDGVCCDTACGGGDPTDCQACSTAANAAANGVCGPLVKGTVCRMDGAACAVCSGVDTTCPASSSVDTCPKDEPKDGGAASSSGSGGGAPTPADSSGCGCRLTGDDPAGGAAGIALLGLTLLSLARRRRAL